MTNNSKDILKIENIEVMYDSVISALHNVSLSVPRGKIVALLGGNGAGKSTTLKAISTMLASERGKVTKGKIIYDGTSVTNQNPTEMVALGMVQVLEGRRCFGSSDILPTGDLPPCEKGSGKRHCECREQPPTRR